MGKIPSSGVTMGRRPKPILEEGRRRVRRLPANRRPSHKVTLGLAEGAISRSPAEPSQALKPDRMTDSRMADIRRIRRPLAGPGIRVGGDVFLCHGPPQTLNPRWAMTKK